MSRRGVSLASAIAFLIVFLACGITGALPLHEESVTVEGEMQVLCVEHFDTHDTETVYTITDPATGKMKRVKFENEPHKPPLTGDKVRIHGKKHNEEIVLPANGSGTYETVQAAAAVAGERKAVVLLVNFLDKTNTCSTSIVQGIVSPDPDRNYTNTNVSDYYFEASYQQVLFDFDVQQNGYADIFGPFTINVYASDPCPDYLTAIYDWAAKADQAATAAGVTLSNYQHIIYVFPTGHSCGFVGLGNIGCGTQCRTWLTGCSYVDAFAHELGHNLGMQHAASDTNNDGVMEDEYGDFSGIMGYSGVGYRHPNAPHKDHMGWFNAFANASETVTTAGTYYVAPLGLDPAVATIPQVLKLYIPARGQYYYLSYRVKDGYEQSFWSTTYPDKLNIHRASEAAGTKTYFIRALSDGQQFSDPSLGVTITNVGHNADPVAGYVAVDIAFECASNAPALAVSPLSQTTGGVAVSYSASVKNMDAGGCGAATFEVVAAAPSGWGVDVSPSSLTLDPGAIGDTVVTITPASGAVDGTYTISLTVEDPSGVRASVVRYVSCVLDLTRPAPIDGLTATIERKKTVALDWPASNENVLTYRVYRDDGLGYVLLAATSGTSYFDSSLGEGSSADYYVVVVDPVGNVSAPSNVVSVAIPAKTPGGGRPTKK